MEVAAVDTVTSSYRWNDKVQTVVNHAQLDKKAVAENENVYY